MAGTGGFGSNASLSFRDAIPADIKRYDMLISLDRVASLDAEGCTFVHGGRGMVISSVGVRIVNNSFHNGFGSGGTTNSILFLEGGCGAYEDYTEGPFSSDILIEGNQFTTDEKGGSTLGTAAQGAIQLAGCRPLGNCTHTPPTQPHVVPPASASTPPQIVSAGEQVPLVLYPHQAWMGASCHTMPVRAWPLAEKAAVSSASARCLCCLPDLLATYLRGTTIGGRIEPPVCKPHPTADENSR